MFTIMRLFVPYSEECADFDVLLCGLILQEMMVWPVVLAGNCPEPKTNSFRRVIYIFNIYKVQRFTDKKSSNIFPGKMHFLGGPNLEHLNNICEKGNFCLKRVFIKIQSPF